MAFQSTKGLKKHAYTVASSIFLTLSLNLMGGPLLQAKAKEEEQVTVYTKLASLHLPSMAKQEMAEQKLAEEAADHNKQIRDENQKKWFPEAKLLTDIQISGLGDATALRTAYSIFSKNESPILPANSLKMSVHQDLELNCGNDKNAPDRNVLNKILRPYIVTKAGDIQSRRMVDTPLTDIQALQKRQAVVKALIEDEELFNKIDRELAQIKQSENDFLYFWKELDEATEEYFNKPYFQNLLLKNLNSNELALETGALWTTVGAPTLQATFPLLIVFAYAFILQKAKDIIPQHELDAIGRNANIRLRLNEGVWATYLDLLTICGKAISLTAEGIVFGTVKGHNLPMSGVQRIITGASFALMGFLYYKGIRMTVDLAIEFDAITKQMQKNLISAGTFCQSSLNLASLLNKKELNQQISSVGEIAQTFNTQAKNPAGSQVGKNLLTDTFKGKPTYFCNKGRVMNTFNDMRQLRDHFIDTMKAVGDIDTCMAIAKLYKKHAKNGNAKFCFVEYINNATTPQVSLGNFWNPMIDPERVVTNNIEIGTNAMNPRNIIITGPNAGGKSTVLKGVTLAIILGQTLGIAPADRMVFTPFHLINTYLNIADASGVESLFQAEMRRVEDLLREIRSMKRNEFSYVIMDEIFTGTNPKEGMAGAYGIAKKLSTYSNNISLIATHFMVLTELEKDTNNLFANKKVRVNRDEFGKISYIYKLESGITDQAIALDLLAQSGFDSEILADAQHIFNRKAAPAA